MRVYFVRHGESAANTLKIISNRGDYYGLTPTGQQQSQALAEKLKPFPISAIFTSPLCRAIETAKILSQTLELPYQITDTLREYDCGILEGKSDPESWQLHQEIADDWALHQNWHRRPDQGESFLDIKNRFLPFIASLTQDASLANAQILLVGHGGLFKQMLPLILTNIEPPFVIAQGISHTDCIIAELQPDGFRCLQWGEIHLR
ncbi:MAG: histidine phosphatase family protein [Leptolyngbyaceae cyanobacterium]